MWIRIIKSRLADSVERLFYKTPVRRFRPQWFFSAFFFLLLFSIIIVILNYCKVDYKVFIIRNNKLIYLSRMKPCLWGWSCYHYSLAQRSVSHRIYMFLATLSIICKCGNRLRVIMVCEWARPTEVFKLVLSLRDHTYRYVRTHTHRQEHAHTPYYHGTQTKTKVDVQ